MSGLASLLSRLGTYPARSFVWTLWIYPQHAMSPLYKALPLVNLSLISGPYFYTQVLWTFVVLNILTITALLYHVVNRVFYCELQNSIVNCPNFLSIFVIHNYSKIVSLNYTFIWIIQILYSIWIWYQLFDPRVIVKQIALK